MALPWFRAHLASAFSLVIHPSDRPRWRCRALLIRGWALRGTLYRCPNHGLWGSLREAPAAPIIAFLMVTCMPSTPGSWAEVATTGGLAGIPRQGKPDATPG